MRKDMTRPKVQATPATRFCLQSDIIGPACLTWIVRCISETDIITNRAAGYRLIEGKLKNQEWVSPTMNTTADGSLYFSVLDLPRWDAALYTNKLLKKSSLEEMWMPVKLNNGKTQGYGFGWSLGEIRGHRIIEHDGAWQGFESHIARYPDEKLTVVVFANLARSKPVKIAHGIAALCNPELAPLPTPTKGKESKN